MCGAWAPACEECFATFVRRSFALDRACIVGSSEDGSDDVTIDMRSGQSAATLKITAANREAVAAEGWRAFSDLPDSAFEIKQPHGDDIRAAAGKA
jgi:hypothetical protein